MKDFLLALLFVSRLPSHDNLPSHDMICTDANTPLRIHAPRPHLQPPMPNTQHSQQQHLVPSAPEHRPLQQTHHHKSRTPALKTARYTSERNASPSLRVSARPAYLPDRLHLAPLAPSARTPLQTATTAAPPHTPRSAPQRTAWARGHCSAALRGAHQSSSEFIDAHQGLLRVHRCSSRAPQSSSMLIKGSSELIDAHQGLLRAHRCSSRAPQSSSMLIKGSSELLRAHRCSSRAP
jgi:hypothetical protein